MPKQQFDQSKRGRRFSELAQLLQLNEAIAAPGRDDEALAMRERQGNVSNALQLLGLQQQSDQAKIAGDTARDRSLVDAATLLGQQGLNPVALEALTQRFPELAAAHGKVKEANLASAVQKMQPQVSAIYGSGVGQSKMKPMLDALSASNPDAFNALPWTQLNSEMPGAPAPAPMPANTPGTIPGRVGGTARQLPNALAAGGAAIPNAVGGGITDFLQGLFGFSDDSRRTASDIVHDVWSAPAEGVWLAKEKLTRKR